MRRFTLVEVADDSLSPWEGILHQWIYLNNEMYKSPSPHGNVAPYSYKESTNKSLMAAAAIKAGWFALEECESKKAGNVSGKGKTDILIWRERLHFRVEAKLTCDSLDELRYKLSDRRMQARNAAQKHADEFVGGRIIAMLFIVPRVCDGDNVGFEEELEKFIAECRCLKPGFLGAVFPGRTERRSGDSNDANMFSHGIIVIGDVL